MEDYKKVLAISGKSGLFKLVGQMKNGVVAESLEDGKRFPVFVSENISSLEDISIFTEDGEFPLKKVFEKIHELESGKGIKIDFNNTEDLKSYFSKILPNYDKERVYTSDIKKALKWYNTLLEKSLLVLEGGSSKTSSDKEEVSGDHAKKAPKKEGGSKKSTGTSLKPKVTKTVAKVAPKAPPKKITTPRKAS